MEINSFSSCYTLNDLAVRGRGHFHESSVTRAVLEMSA